MTELALYLSILHFTIAIRFANFYRSSIIIISTHQTKKNIKMKELSRGRSRGTKILGGDH